MKIFLTFKKPVTTLIRHVKMEVNVRLVEAMIFASARKGPVGITAKTLMIVKHLNAKKTKLTVLMIR